MSNRTGRNNHRRAPARFGGLAGAAADESPGFRVFLHFFQFDPNVGHGLKAPFRVFAQTADDNPLQFGRDIGVEFSKRFGFEAQNSGEHSQFCVATKGSRSGQQFI